MDENGSVLGQAQKVKVIVRRGRRNPRYTQDENREMVTVVDCISADGRAIPPLYIYKGSSHTMGWHAAVKKDDDATFAYSPKGWTDNELGLEWLERNFEKFTKDM